ncbi:TetR/AcrR family transcriptional regulator [Microbaculum marinisediminis]|uniref:TetR/AcrR family transcriptional regulator n=1 Tax=Microbaculum marinisediminis TaxID=2931392 RepID=A0AAW5R4F7_9HYPH|nr:TetR/AcrR family transcriptional regulator [Microbaculum sp. A6E488]MCT8973763.1 TetR/AcrR family transcriptional regulator [Microbaculum sp. A6E488]
MADKAAKPSRPENKPARGSAKPKRSGNNVRKELVRQQMLEKSAELFCANGFAKTSINDIADSLSLKRSSVYHYFQNKEEIIRELFLEEYERRCSELTALFERKNLTALDRLVLAVEGAITQRLRGGSRFMVFDRLEAEAPAELRISYNRSRRQILDLYTRLISDGIETKEFRSVDPQLTAFAVIGMSNWTALWYSPSGRMTPNEVATTLVNLLVRGIEFRDGDRDQPGSLAMAIRYLREDLEGLERLAAQDNE